MMNRMLRQIPGPAGQRVLLVTHHPRIRCLAQVTLVRAGFHVEVAGSADEALQRARRSLPDLVVFEGNDLEMVRLVAGLGMDEVTQDVEVLRVTGSDLEGPGPRPPEIRPFATD